MMKPARKWGAPSPAGVPAPRPMAELLRDRAGAVYTEYILIVILIGIIVSAALIAIGVPIWRAFRMTQLFLGAPIP